ncbi:hypothetical protein D3C87_1784560 [compost metagenome]
MLPWFWSIEAIASSAYPVDLIVKSLVSRGASTRLNDWFSTTAPFLIKDTVNILLCGRVAEKFVACTVTVSLRNGWIPVLTLLVIIA